MSSRRTVLSSTAIAAVLGLGLGTWFALASGEEKRKEQLKTMPKSNPIKMEDIRKNNTLTSQVLKDAVESKDNTTRDLKAR